MRSIQEMSWIDTAVDDLSRCENSSVLSCIDKTTKEGFDRGDVSEVGTVYSGRGGRKGQFLRGKRKNLVKKKKPASFGKKKSASFGKIAGKFACVSFGKALNEMFLPSVVKTGSNSCSGDVALLVERRDSRLQSFGSTSVAATRRCNFGAKQSTRRGGPG